eukprot:1161841-Pelagomonas_calceolata.AAC.16
MQKQTNDIKLCYLKLSHDRYFTKGLMILSTSQAASLVSNRPPDDDQNPYRETAENEQEPGGQPKSLAKERGMSFNSKLSLGSQGKKKEDIKQGSCASRHP